MSRLKFRYYTVAYPELLGRRSMVERPKTRANQSVGNVGFLTSQTHNLVTTGNLWLDRLPPIYTSLFYSRYHRNEETIKFFRL